MIDNFKTDLVIRAAMMSQEETRTGPSPGAASERPAL